MAPFRLPGFGFPSVDVYQQFRNVAIHDLYNLSTARNTPKGEVAKRPSVTANALIDERPTLKKVVTCATRLRNGTPGLSLAPKSPEDVQVSI